MRTANSIIASFTNRTMQGEVIPPEEWLLGAGMLTVLMKEETDKLFDLQQQVSKIKLDSMTAGDTAAKAKIIAEASDALREMKRQAAFVEQIIEFIRISKKQSDIANK